MQQINAPKPPAWRDPVRLRTEARARRLRPILGALSAVDLALLLLPPDGAYDEAISMQLARGATTAWALFVAMGVTLGYLAVRLWRWENRFGAIASILIIVGLGTIAVTHPYSSTHQETFLAMCGSIVLGHFVLMFARLDFRLIPTTALSAFAVFLLFAHLGIGERLLIGATLATLNLLVYGDLDA